MSALYPYIKRAVDVLVAAFMLVLTMSGLAVAVTLCGGRLVRVPMRGQGGRIFILLFLNVPHGRLASLASGLGAKYALAWMHVLKGDLSLIGPRSLTPGEFSDIPAQALARRQSLRPGLVCYWSVRKRTNIDYGREIDSDLEYVDRPTLEGDLALAVRALLASLYGARRRYPHSRVRIGTVELNNLTLDEVIGRILAATARQPLQVCFVNPDCVNIAHRDVDYRDMLHQAGLVLADGIGMKIAGNLLATPIRQNVNGTDLFPRLCQALEGGAQRLYLLGGKPGVAEDVRNWIARNYPGVTVAGLHHGYFDAETEPAVLEDIRQSRATMLLVAFGAPRQEAWIARNLAATGVNAALGVGGLFDFYAGRIPRAPLWLREIGGEWMYRFIQEPRRMWKRYLVGNLLFLFRVLQQRRHASPAPELSPRLEETVMKPYAHIRRAILVAAKGASPDKWAAGTRHPAMMPLVDRPILQRQVESLVALGVERIDFLLCEQAAELEQFLGNGERWGCVFSHHLVRDPRRPYGRLKEILAADDERVVFGHADCLIDFSATPEPSVDTALVWIEGKRPAWTGWGMFHTSTLRQMVNWGRNFAGLERAVLARLENAALTRDSSWTGIVLDSHQWVRTPDELLAAQQMFFNHPQRFPVHAHEVEKGVWIGRNVSIHPTARLHSPVYIGENSRIEEYAHIGPATVVCGDNVIDARSKVEKSMILAGTYVGIGTEMDRAVADGERLMDTRLGVALWVPDRAILGNLAERRAASRETGLPERLFAAFLLAMFLPFTVLLLLPLALAGWRYRVARHRIVTPATPAAPCGKEATLHCLESTPDSLLVHRRFLRHFITAFVPQLVDVLTGKFHLVGAKPRTRAEMAKSSGDAQRAYLAAQPGIISEALLQGVAADDPEMADAADAYYAVQAGLIYDGQLLCRYLIRVLRDTIPWRIRHSRPAYPLA